MFKSLLHIFSKGNNGIMKIILLGTGLVMGIVLIAKIYYEQVFDNYMDDPHRVYIIETDYSSRTDEPESWGQTSGAIAPGIKAYSAAVEAATRTTPLESGVSFTIPDQNGNPSNAAYTAKNIVLADSAFFEIFTRKITGNDPKEGLNTRAHIYISRSFAETISKADPDALIGSMLFPAHQNEDSRKFVIDGIYEDFPDNSTFKNTDIVMSMPSIDLFMWDGSDNWMWNDRYYSYVKLFQGRKAEDVEAGIKEMCLKHLPQEELEKSGADLSYHLEPLSSYNMKNADTASTCLNLLIFTILVLGASVLNYVLISISAAVHKSKTVAVHKCYGASKYDIYKMIFSETLANIVLSLIFGALLITAFRNPIEELTGITLENLITPDSMAIMGFVVLLIFFLCGFLPGTIYARIPVANAFRRYKEVSRKWKLTLLFLQFAASAFLISLLAVVILQYRHMLKSDLGYAYENLAVVSTGSEYGNKRENIKQEIARLPFVESVTSATNLPVYGASGNSISLPGEEKEYLNIADMFSVGRGYVKTMGINIVDGRNFNEDATVSGEVMVSRSFAEKMRVLANWEDGATGKSIVITEHSTGPNDVFTICGVYDDFILGSFQGRERDTRPTVHFYAPESYAESGDEGMRNSYRNMRYVIVKLKEMSPQHLAAIEQLVSENNPNVESRVVAYRDKIISSYAETVRFRNSVTAAGSIVLLITLIGLLGYAQDEINRRRSELAIRKVHGATVSEIMKLFIYDVLKLALPAAVIGCAAAYLVSGMILEMYSYKIEPAWYIFAGSGIFVLAVISAAEVLRIYAAANINPVNNLKNE